MEKAQAGNDLIPMPDARDIAALIKEIADKAAWKAVGELLGAHREYAFHIADPDATPLMTQIYNICLDCAPIEFVVDVGIDPATLVPYAPTGTASLDVMRSTDAGATWTAITSAPTTIASGHVRGVGSAFASTELAPGDLVTMRLNTGGGAKGLVGQFRTQRIGEHPRRRG